MPYPKSAEQTTFEWMPPLPFYNLGQSKNMCTRIFSTQFELKEDVVENKLIKWKNLWINPYICLITIKFHFSGTHFDNKFPTFGVVSCIMVPAPIIAYLGFAKFLAEIILEILYGVKTV